MTTSARRFLKRGIIGQQFMNIVLIARYFAGASPEKLAAQYFKTAAAADKAIEEAT